MPEEDFKFHFTSFYMFLELRGNSKNKNVFLCSMGTAVHNRRKLASKKLVENQNSPVGPKVTILSSAAQSLGFCFLN